ncbi:MAG: hypothetical protein JST01_22015 [Cyanobacteria bacterium SZAS TMP-1]|nr:hypothetical protein [Cyanobacteria bacterium SZAS TMP-1]
MFSALFSGLKRLGSWKPLAQDPPPNSNPTDSYFQKLVTYIPADIIAAWVALSGILSQAGTTTPQWLSWAVFIGLLLLTPFYVCYLKTTPPGLTSNKMFHWITSCVAFVAWVFALGSPFNTLSWYLPVYGSVLLVFVTLVIPVMERLFIKDPVAGSNTKGSDGKTVKPDKGSDDAKKDDGPPSAK